MGKSKAQKARQRKSKAKGGKPGNPGNFKGARNAWLRAQLPDYLKLVPTHRYTAFWADVHARYWQAFPYWVPLSDDPTPEDLARAEEDVPEDIKEQKSKIIASTNKVRQIYRCSNPARHLRVHRASKAGSAAKRARIDVRKPNSSPGCLKLSATRTLHPLGNSQDGNTG